MPQGGSVVDHCRWPLAATSTARFGVSARSPPSRCRRDDHRAEEDVGQGPARRADHGPRSPIGTRTDDRPHRRPDPAHPPSRDHGNSQQRPSGAATGDRPSDRNARGHDGHQHDHRDRRTRLWPPQPHGGPRPTEPTAPRLGKLARTRSGQTPRRPMNRPTSCLRLLTGGDSPRGPSPTTPLGCSLQHSMQINSAPPPSVRGTNQVADAARELHRPRVAGHPAHPEQLHGRDGSPVWRVYHQAVRAPGQDDLPRRLRGSSRGGAHRSCPSCQASELREVEARTRK